MTREQCLEEALKLACDWSGLSYTRRNSVISCAIIDLLEGKDDSSMIPKARDLVAGQVKYRNRHRS